MPWKCPRVVYRIIWVRVAIYLRISKHPNQSLSRRATRDFSGPVSRPELLTMVNINYCYTNRKSISIAICTLLSESEKTFIHTQLQIIRLYLMEKHIIILARHSVVIADRPQQQTTFPRVYLCNIYLCTVIIVVLFIVLLSSPIVYNQ